MYKPSVNYRFRVRYSNATAVSADFTQSSFYFFAVTGITSTTAFSLNDSVSIKRIEIWSPPATTGGVSSASVSYSFNGSAGTGPGGGGRPAVATTIGAAECGHLVSVPPQNAIAGMWLRNDNSDGIMQMILPATSIVDITYEAIITFNSFTTSPYSYSGASAGGIFLAGIRDTSGIVQLVPIEPVIAV
jgi:hypothetical protein